MIFRATRGVMLLLAVITMLVALAACSTSTAHNPKKETSVNLPMPLSTMPDGTAVPLYPPGSDPFRIAETSQMSRAGYPVSLAWLIKQPGGRLTLLAGMSPDDGCELWLQSTKDGFFDPCHGSGFDLDGRPLHGPASTPISKINWRVVTDRTIAVEVV